MASGEGISVSFAKQIELEGVGRKCMPEGRQRQDVSLHKVGHSEVSPGT